MGSGPTTNEKTFHPCDAFHNHLPIVDVTGGYRCRELGRLAIMGLVEQDTSEAFVMNLAINLSEQELAEIRRRTDASDDADAVCRAAREYLRTCQLRDLTTAAVDYDNNAWRDLDQAELSQPELHIESDGDGNG